MMNRRLTVVAVAALLGTGALAPVSEASADKPADPGYRVVLADLDLGSASGVEALYGRLRTAALEVCGFADARGHAQRQRARRCVGATLDAAVAEVGRSSQVSPRLVAEHRAGRNRVPDAGAEERLVTSSR